MPSTVPTSRAVPAPPIQPLRDGKHCVQRAADTRATSVPVSAARIAHGERLLRLRDVLTIVGLSRAHVYNLVKQGLFPRPIALGSNCARWVQSEVEAWVDASIVAARSPDTKPHVSRMNLR